MINIIKARTAVGEAYINVHKIKWFRHINENETLIVFGDGEADLIVGHPMERLAGWVKFHAK